MVRLSGTAFKGVFLDMDGVVADSSSLWDAIIRIIRQEFALDMSVLEKSGGYDYTTAEALRIVLESMGCFSRSLLADIMRRIDTIYLSGLVSVKPVPGIPDVLDMLGRRGVMTALVSNSSRYQVSMMLEHLGLEKHFQSFISLQVVGLQCLAVVQLLSSENKALVVDVHVFSLLEQAVFIQYGLVKPGFGILPVLVFEVLQGVAVGSIFRAGVL